MRFSWPTIGAMGAAGLVLLGWISCQTWTVQAADAPPAAATSPPGLEVVEPSMHEFMEYVFMPAYKRLKAAYAAGPKDKATWRPIKAEALALAESCNLLLLRKPDEGSAEEWNAHAIATRAEATKLYRAAAKLDDAAARPAYEAMLQRCNACHKQFEDGKHILTP